MAPTPKTATRRSSRLATRNAVPPTAANVSEIEKAASTHVSAPLADRVLFWIFRGLSSLCFVVPHVYSARIIHNDIFARYAIFTIMVCSLGWNNLAFAIPQAFLPGTIPKIPLHLTLLASTLDGFGMVSANLVALSYTLGTGYNHHWPWIVAAIYSTCEHVLVVNSQGPHCPKFVGLSGGVITKVHYPFCVHVFRSLAVAGAVFSCMYHLLKAGKLNDVFVMVGALVVAFVTYMTNGYDRDFTCTRVWIWHGMCSLFGLYEVDVMRSLGA